MKALFLLMPDKFRDEEFKIPKERLENAGVQVTVAGLRDGDCTGMLGMHYTPNTTIDDVVVDEFDAVVVPGGGGSSTHLWNNLKVQQLVRWAYDQGKVVAGICLATAMFAYAGILDGRNATVFPTSQAIEVLKENGANYVKEDIVVDGNIITAVGPKAAAGFADAILEKLGSA